MDLTNPCFACNPTPISAKTNVSLKKEELNKARKLLTIKTWGNPKGDLVKPGVPVLPLISKFWIKSDFGTLN